MPKKAKREKVQKPREPVHERLRFGLLLFLLATQPILFSPWNTEYGYVKSIYTLVLVAAILSFGAWKP